MTPSAHKNLVYFFGPEITHLAPDTRINIKIGLSGNNNENFFQRLGEHQRHCPRDICHASFPTNGGDAAVRKLMCSMFPQKFGTNRGKGHEVISLLVKDVQFLLEQSKLYFNDINYGNAKLYSFSMRQEQIDFVRRVVAFFSDPLNIGKEFLCDAKMRFGKTHTAYEVIMAMDFGLILILTGRPTDTKKAWIDAMNHTDFDFGPDNFIDASLQGKEPIVVNPNKRTIIFSSLQDFARIIEGGFKEKFVNFPTLTFDLLIKDEVHLAFDTPNTEQSLSKINYKHALELSGTAFQALFEGRFTDDAKFTWSYIDEQRARKEELVRLGQEVAEKEGQYYWLCPMKIFTILLSPQLYNEADQFTEEEGFTFTKLFATEEKNGKLAFRNDIAVRSFINTLCHSSVMPYSNQAHNVHQYNSINIKHTLWCVPGVPEAKTLAALLKKHEIFKQYDIIVAAGDNDKEGNDTVNLVESRIASIESGINKTHIGTITLSCGKLFHGVSIPEWGSVFNLSDMKSAQLYFQLIFRCQTPWSGIEDKHPGGPKYECYVFDFNPNRTLTHIHELAKLTAKEDNIKHALSEYLNVFNVLCYDENGFRTVSPDDLISKLESGFGSSTSLLGLQNLFAELPFEMDAELWEGLADIEGGGSSKSKVIEVNHNDAKNGKNTKRKSEEDDINDDSDDNTDDDNEDDNDDKDISEDQKLARMKLALKTVPLYFLFTRDESFNDLISNLTTNENAIVCKAITGIPARSLKKVLSNQSQDKKDAISLGLTRFRLHEKKDYEEFLAGS
jgi:hypothetical protein